MPPAPTALWQYRHFILASVVTELRLRFDRSLLGGLWGVLNPLAQVAIFALILSNVLQAKIDNLDSK